MRKEGAQAMAGRVCDGGVEVEGCRQQRVGIAGVRLLEHEETGSEGRHDGAAQVRRMAGGRGEGRPRGVAAHRPGDVLRAAPVGLVNRVVSHLHDSMLELGRTQAHAVVTRMRR